MNNYIQGISRRQLYLFNECLDELVGENSIVRFIDAYVESLDMREIGFRMHEQKTGAPAYRPQLKLKIYIYGYFERIRTSRKLEKECQRNKEMMWLTEGLAPDFKTIADFRKDNCKALKRMFKEFLKLCLELDLITFETVAIDGSKLRGRNGLNEIYSQERMERIEKDIREKIERYFAELDEMDKKELETGISVNEEKIKEIAERLSKQVKREGKIEQIVKIFEDNPKITTYYATDSDCRLQSDKGKVRPGYNVQTAVDGKEKLIVVADVTNEQNDKRMLTPMIRQIEDAKQELGVQGKTEGVADCGYFSEKQIMEHLDKGGIHVVVPPEVETAIGNEEKDFPRAGYRSKDFRYEKGKDVFICPQGNELERITQTTVMDRHGRETYKYRCQPETCASCLQKDNCTKSKKGRMLRVSKNNEIMNGYLSELTKEESKKLIAKRKEIVEHPFGTMKRTMGYTHFLLKGLEKVRAEFSFICFIYNLKRVFNILPFNKLSEALIK